MAGPTSQTKQQTGTKCSGLRGIVGPQTSWEVAEMLICGFQFNKCVRHAAKQMFPKKDTADGEADLKRGGADAEWVEDPLVAGQNTPPGQLGEHDGVEADAREAESSTEVVEEWQVTRLRSAVHTRGSEEEDMAETKTKTHKVEVHQNIQLKYAPVEINTGKVVNVSPNI